MKTTLGTIVAILLFSLAAWVFFYLTSGPLTAGETTVVVGFVAIAVSSFKWLWSRIRKPHKENRP